MIQDPLLQPELENIFCMMLTISHIVAEEFWPNAAPVNFGLRAFVFAQLS